ncbi:hypothetical protein TWF106_001051 [Orbilia oligospora]|uniref:Uncharacterized protein n=1 Tax=Orbilia oligospora TaxID=2813651 RepID=A0A6G1LUL0_ORBOL|nr:hypothetical protein TWF788_002332 [Orbilia oligospora]KAF3198708.1 hypothetical protein TWF679_001799 [Orbilia oligospora]KAF3205729.1 hypothetical protein TWF106_001051 [Orbilia oligospora]KAF3226482.1 hypothetical protein TWF191_004744 [Orbilia oligospora]KAF3234600.1 hypothetical protein TWF192_001273 [Orbilia oligospora]
MSTETPAATTTPNTRTTNINNAKPSSASGISGVGAATTRDLDAHEWSQAVIDELQHIQVATPPTKGVCPSQLSDGLGNRGHMCSSQPRRFTHNSGEIAPKQESGYNQRNTSHQELHQRPQAGTMDSTATIDIIKQIPGSW